MISHMTSISRKGLKGKDINTYSQGSSPQHLPSHRFAQVMQREGEAEAQRGLSRTHSST